MVAPRKAGTVAPREAGLVVAGLKAASVAPREVVAGLKVASVVPREKAALVAKRGNTRGPRTLFDL